jgi:hypothetical protein
MKRKPAEMNIDAKLSHAGDVDAELVKAEGSETMLMMARRVR